LRAARNNASADSSIGAGATSQAVLKGLEQAVVSDLESVIAGSAALVAQAFSVSVSARRISTAEVGIHRSHFRSAPPSAR
jgi:hypothetical protein